MRSIAKRAGIGAVNPHMLRAAFIMCALDAGVPLREVQIAARHADPRTTTVYDHRQQSFDRHAAYVVVAFVSTLVAMSEERSRETPLLDEWRAEVGDDVVAAAVEAARTQIADGSLRGFSDKDELREYLQRSHRRSA